MELKTTWVREINEIYKQYRFDVYTWNLFTCFPIEQNAMQIEVAPTPAANPAAKPQPERMIEFNVNRKVFYISYKYR